MGWSSCYTKQRINYCRLLCRIIRTDNTRKCHKIWRWTLRRRKGWSFEVHKTIDQLQVREIVYDDTKSTKCAMRTIIDKLNEQDNIEWHNDLHNDRANVQNGNKLRTYRLYKNSVEVESYVKTNIPRMERRTMALFRSGSLPLAYETGRYSRPPVPINDRLCTLCDNNAIETEKHFFMECPLYSDLRFDLFSECTKSINNFNVLNTDQKFYSIMTSQDVQRYACKYIHKFYMRRKLFLP